jgi:ADP-ribose pyrophosphatase YjhB (NUDIX family)
MKESIDGLLVKSNKKKSFPKPERITFKVFKSVFSKVPRLCIDLLVASNDLGVVLVKRDIPPSKGCWHLPGGGVLFGEDLADATHRIAKAEIGIEVRINKLLGVVEFTGNSIVGHGVSLVFLARPVSEKLRGSAEGKDLAFFKTLPTPIIEEHRNLLIKLGYFIP